MGMDETTLTSPFGPICLRAAGGALRELSFAEGARARPAAGGVLARARDQLEAYFAGELTAFDLPLDPAGTVFHRRVWELVAAIPFGETATYGELARRLDAPGAARAVGAANGANPLAVVIPCHRVVGARGALTGYAYGVDRKAGLLALERGASPLALAG
jgi:methylated-DNA-[protein]-cysteine S-methyltransferase